MFTELTYDELLKLVDYILDIKKHCNDTKLTKSELTDIIIKLHNSESTDEAFVERMKQIVWFDRNYVTLEDTYKRYYSRLWIQNMLINMIAPVIGLYNFIPMHDDEFNTLKDSLEVVSNVDGDDCVVFLNTFETEVEKNNMLSTIKDRKYIPIPRRDDGDNLTGCVEMVLSYIRFSRFDTKRRYYISKFY